MAAEAVLSSFLGVVFDRLAKPEVVNWIRGKKLDQKLLQGLETILSEARAVLNDAEQKQMKDHRVKKWLSDLKDAVYVADDLLDDVSTLAEIQKLAGNSKPRYLNLQDGEIVNKMEEIIETLKRVIKQKDNLGLKEVPKENMSWRITTSLVEKSTIYGRDKDKEAIMKLLLDDTSDGEISVIPIVGLGGIGKTTLAQLVYHDDKVKQNFNRQAWVCVSEEFDIIKVTRTIIEAITRGSCNTNDLNLLQEDLKEKLTKQKFFVVLDDAWNEDSDDWNILLKPFQHGVKGSKILITTRSKKVASVVQTVQPHILSLLSYEDCWLVFTEHALLSSNSIENPTLEKIGREIVSKCNGLPLAARTLGDLLRGNYDIRYWNHTLKSEIWELPEDRSKIIPALRISYYYLPSYLKECFVSCSLYPKDYNFNKDEIILMWIAEDLLPASKRGRALEEIGSEYFDELVARSFFQPHSTDIGLFVMHDLMHDLATFYAGEFYFRAEALENAVEISAKTRHLSHNVMGNYPISKLLEACDRVKHTRTFLEVYSKPWHQFNMENAPSILLSQLKYLRVLSFKTCFLDELPNSIGELIHLRYLDLSTTGIVTLPESIGNLYNLQTLKLTYCEGLKMLPSTMQNLVNLRHLDIRGTNLKEMPKGMSKLKDLQFLSSYFIGKHEENGISELGAIASLRGSLYIYNLENVIDSSEASEAKMFRKEHINVLNLSWSSDGDIADSQTERDILDRLQPYIDLKELSIKGYRGTKFPEWLGHSSYHYMTDLKLMGCCYCCKLPSLGQLPSLKSLRLVNFDSPGIIEPEFYGNDEFHGVTPFPALKTLEFHKMSCWQEWQSFGFEFDAFPQLEKLSIQECPMLIGNLPNHLLALERLIIKGCDQLACSLPRAPDIVELEINGKQEVRLQEQSLSRLRFLSIEGCQLVESVFEAMTHSQPTSLRSLHIKGCSSAISFPGSCLPASLQELEIYDCKNLEIPTQQQQQQQQQQHGSLRSLVICDSCDSLTSFPLSAFPNLTTFRIRRCENIKSHEVSQSQDAAPPSLRELTIHECPSFVSLLSQSRQNAALPGLRDLSIYSCPSLVSLSTLGLAAPQLEELHIWSCPEVGSLAEGDEGLPPNLSELWIAKCEKLVRCLASSTVLHSPGLFYLGISGACESVKSFPREGCLPASLKSLYLASFPSLETLDCNGLLHLTSLQYLIIQDCPKLENMAGERLPASLTTLYICQCPLLGAHFQMKDPLVWPKISHIRYISVDKKWIS